MITLCTGNVFKTSRKMHWLFTWTAGAAWIARGFPGRPYMYFVTKVPKHYSVYHLDKFTLSKFVNHNLMKINARENRVLVILSGSLLFWPFPERLDLHLLLFWPFLERLDLLAHSFYSLTRSGSLQCESTCSKFVERHAALCDSGTQVYEIVSRDCLSLPGRDVGCFWCIEISPHVHDSVKLHFFSDRLYYN